MTADQWAEKWNWAASFGVCAEEHTVGVQVPIRIPKAGYREDLVSQLEIYTDSLIGRMLVSKTRGMGSNP